MSAPAEQHPLESLYEARDALQAAVNTLPRYTSEQVTNDLGSYATVNTAIITEFRTLLDTLASTVDVSRSAVNAAHVDLCEVLALFDQILSYADQRQATTENLYATVHEGLDRTSHVS